MLEKPEMSLKEWLDSSWSIRLGRLFMQVGIPALLGAVGYVGWVITDLKTNVTTVREALAIRTRDNESFQADVNRDLDVIRAGLAAGGVTVVSLSNDVSAVKLDVATIKGMLSQIARDNVASRTAIPHIPGELQ